MRQCPRCTWVLVKDFFLSCHDKEAISFAIILICYCCLFLLKHFFFVNFSAFSTVFNVFWFIPCKKHSVCFLAKSKTDEQFCHVGIGNQARWNQDSRHSCKIHAAQNPAKISMRARSAKGRNSKATRGIGPASGARVRGFKP